VSALIGLQCHLCKTPFPAEATYVCDKCLGPLEPVYDYSAVHLTREEIERRPKNLWRYRELLPITGEPRTGFNSGYTPLVRCDRLAKRLGASELYIKDDSVNHPTLSYKDRVVSVAATRALELGFNVLACASTGNLANSVAAHAARLGVECCVFIPDNLEAGKLLGSAIFNPTILAIAGNYDDVNRLCTELSADHPWAFVNVNLRPYYAEGSKTLGFEIAEQLGFELPDRVVVPVASGSLFTRIARGFEEWVEVGLLEGELPIFNGAQAEGCSPVAQAFAEGSEICRPVKPETIAKSLAIGNPADGVFALDLARRTGGAIDAVTDEEIVDGIKLLAETTGVFTETAGGVTIGVLAKLAETGEIESDERVVAYITGEGLKTLDAVRESFRMHEIAPTIDAFEAEFRGAEVSA
jgi:threonine synthase